MSLLQKPKLDFKQLIPLIQETALRINQLHPQMVQTGPAFREDLVTVEKHLELLKDSPLLTSIYKLMTSQIIEFKKGAKP